MNAIPMTSQATTAAFELRFTSLFDTARGLCFPCDAQGHVDIDSLSSRERINYLYARTVIGREFFMPAIRPASATLH